MGESVEQKISRLRDELNRHIYLYHSKDDPEISDEEYDALFAELQALEAEHPELISGDSPTQRVGAPPSEAFAPVEHAIPMLSLANARTADELLAWEKRIRSRLEKADVDAGDITWVTEPKIDGLAISLTYEHGRFVRGATRGDGRVGEDVTRNIATIEALPKRIDGAPPLIEVRGEVYLPVQAFAELNRRRTEQGLPAFANPRNSAAGSIRQNDPAAAAERPLAVWSYGLTTFRSALALTARLTSRLVFGSRRAGSSPVAASAFGITQTSSCSESLFRSWASLR